MANPFDEPSEEPNPFDAPSAEGEPGHPGHDKYKDGAYAHVDDSPITPTGTPWDAVKNAANVAALGAGPQIEGGMAALAAGLQAHESPAARDDAMLAAYRGVRDMGTKEHDAAARTHWGQTGAGVGMLASPVPFKPAAGASIPRRIAQGAIVGGGTGLLHGAATSKADLTTLDRGAFKEALTNAIVQGITGSGGGAITGGVVGASRSPLKNTAEEQALRAAGLRGGIQNQIQKKLGLSNIEEARALGRQFLDEGLIPLVGSAEKVAKNAENLQGMAGNTIGAELAAAQASGKPFSNSRMAAAARDPLQIAPGKSTAVADLASGKARDFADALDAQGQATPGNWVEANRAKSDAWASANFADDAPIAAQLYRKSVGSARDNIEQQLREAMGPEAAASLNKANKRYGIAADALKLADNAGTRDVAKKGFGLPEIMAITTGAGAAGGHAAGGHSVEGALGGLALALGAKGFDKYGHSSAARFADFLRKRAEANTGGSVGGQLGALGGDKARDALAPYLELLKRPEEPKK